MYGHVCEWECRCVCVGWVWLYMFATLSGIKLKEISNTCAGTYVNKIFSVGS